MSLRSASNGAPRVDPLWRRRVGLRPRQAAVWCVALVLLAASAGCGRIQPGVTAPQDGFSVTLTAQPAPPVVGEGTLIVSLLDPDGRPVTDARLQVEGNMSHAGMQPSYGKVTGGEAGQYTVTIQWTMGGDWHVDLKATLADGRVIVRPFPIAVHVR